jgi:hypothetical protein
MFRTINIGFSYFYETMPDFSLSFSYPRYLFWLISNKLDISIYLKTETPHKMIHIKKLYFEYNGKEYPLLEDATKNIFSKRLKLGKVNNKILRGVFGQFKIGERDSVIFTIEYILDDGSLQIVKRTYDVIRIQYADFGQS